MFACGTGRSVEVKRNPCGAVRVASRHVLELEQFKGFLPIYIFLWIIGFSGGVLLSFVLSFSLF